MFTDSEIGLTIAHDRETAARTRYAQSIINRKDLEIARLRGRLAAAQRTNAELVAEKGQRNQNLLLRRMRARQH